MTRLIDADRVTENLQSFVDWCRDGRRQGAEFCLDCVIPNTPTLEAVPVVRCKDCKHYLREQESCTIHFDEYGYWFNTNDNGFCSLAERKEDDNT